MTHLEVAIKLILAQQKLLVAYRTGELPSWKTLDDITHLKQWLRDAELLP